ncbi:MAG TPA: hypothetical protein VN754_06620 [Candidatus Binataceae bacterium]|nr:hypothetical protein [Candidatus Binataceae bacterium]
MKTRVKVLVGLSVALLALGLGRGQARAQAGDVVVTAATVDITHFTGREPIDQIDLTANFTNNELAEGKRCEPKDNLLFHGVKVTVQPGFCGAKTTKSYVTIPFFQPLAPGSTLANFSGFSMEGATVDALLRTLKTPVGTCGAWSLRVDAVNVNLYYVRRNPVAVTITLPDGSYGCLGITSALIDQ